jgi:hypothetical protein
MAFEEALRDLRFLLERDSRTSRSYVARPNRFLTYYVQTYEDGSALFTWEFAIAAWATSRGLQVGSGEELNTFLYPQNDARGPQDAAWVAAQIERTEALLRSASFLED